MTFQNLIDTITAVIRENGNQEITGQVLQDVLIQMVNSLGENATYAGFAYPTTQPTVPDGKVIWVASTPGIYTYFNNIELEPGQISFLSYENDTWVSQIIYDVDLANVYSKHYDYVMTSGGWSIGNPSNIWSGTQNVNSGQTVTLLTGLFDDLKGETPYLFSLTVDGVPYSAVSGTGVGDDYVLTFTTAAGQVKLIIESTRIRVQNNAGSSIVVTSLTVDTVAIKQYIIPDSYIGDNNTWVDFRVRDGSAETARAANLIHEADVSTGQMTIFAFNTPTEDIEVQIALHRSNGIGDVNEFYVHGLDYTYNEINELLNP